MIPQPDLLARYRGKAILLDSNLLLVFITGTVGAHLFGRFERVRNYTFRDYELLVQLLHSFRTLKTTPHILAEVGSLANKLSGSYREDWYANLAKVVRSAQERIQVNEMWMPAKELAEMPEFISFGVTDSAIVGLASEALVITDDYRLSGALRLKGIDVLNFADLRAIQRAIP